MSKNEDKTTEDDRITDDELEGVAGGALLEPIVSRSEPITKLNTLKPTFGKDGVLIAGTTFPRDT